jgi:hypothetical protein
VIALESCAIKWATYLKRAALTGRKENAVGTPSASAVEKRGMVRSASAMCAADQIAGEMPTDRVMRIAPDARSDRAGRTGRAM